MYIKKSKISVNSHFLCYYLVRTPASAHFPLHSQGDGAKQRHGDGCRVPVSHHLFINLKSFTYNSISEDADVFFFLYDTREAKQIRYAAWSPLVVPSVGLGWGGEPQSANVSILQREVHGEAEQKRRTEEPGEGRPSVRALHGSVAQDEDLGSPPRLQLTRFLSPL